MLNLGSNNAVQVSRQGEKLYQGAVIMTYRDRPCGPFWPMPNGWHFWPMPNGWQSGRREAASDAGHRQGFPTPPGEPGGVPPIPNSGVAPATPDGPHGRPERRLAKAFGRRRARLPMSRIATPDAYGRKPWQTVPMNHYHRSLVLPLNVGIA